MGIVTVCIDRTGVGNVELIDDQQSLQIHVGSTPVTCGGIHGSGVAGENIVMLDDKLSFGPVLSFDAPEFASARKQFWQQHWSDFIGTPPRPEPDILSEFVKKLPALQRAAGIVVWVGNSLDEQLFLACTMALAKRFNIALEKMKINHIGKDPISGQQLQCLDQLRPDRYTEAMQSARTPTSDEVQLFLDGWDAFVSSNPHELAEFPRAKVETMLPFVDRIQSVKGKYPAIGLGLSQTERFILSCCGEDGRRCLDIFLEYHSRHELDAECLSVQEIGLQLLALASDRLPRPLLKVDRQAKMHETVFTLLPTGATALSNEENFVTSNGIDRWIGGVHLKSPDKSWFFDQETNSFVV